MSELEREVFVNAKPGIPDEEPRIRVAPEIPDPINVPESTPLPAFEPDPIPVEQPTSPVETPALTPA